MDPAPADEKRVYPRHRVGGKVSAVVLSELWSSKREGGDPIEGAIEDISEGGIGVVISQPLTELSPIRCEIQLGEFPTSIPTLVQVCWVKTSPSANSARVGLHFLL